MQVFVIVNVYIFAFAFSMPLSLSLSMVGDLGRGRGPFARLLETSWQDQPHCAPLVLLAISRQDLATGYSILRLNFLLCG